jgi:hypothetical protein
MRSDVEMKNFDGLIALVLGKFALADSLFTNLYQPENLRSRGALLFYRAVARFGLHRYESACKDCRIAVSWGESQAAELMERSCPEADITVDNTFPQNFQFYPREANDSARLILSGFVHRADMDSVFVILYRNEYAVSRIAAALDFKQQKESLKSSYTKPGNFVSRKFQARFSLPIQIKSECAEYSFALGMCDKKGNENIVLRRDSLVAGDVLLFGGQSNMVLGNVPKSLKSEYMRTYNLENETSRWQQMNITNNFTGQLGRIGALSGDLARRIVEDRGIPVCAIHSAVNGSSIEQHLPMRRNPPRGIYDNVLNLARQSGLAKNIRGIVWYQGESNTGLGYAERFSALYRAWKVDYPAVQRVYVVQVRPNVCNNFEQSDVREEQRHLPEFFSNVEVIAANAVRDYDGCHFSQQGYEELAGQVYRLVERDFYGSKDSINISSPNLRKAFFADTLRQIITLEFLPATSQISVSFDSLLVNGIYYSLRDAFLLDGRTSEGNNSLLDAPGWIERIETNTINTVHIRLRKGIQAERITYIPNKFYPASNVVYNGPWLVTKRGVGILSFYRVSIQAP